MKPATRQMDVTSTLQGEKIGMTIDENSLAHIMTILTDLYSDPEMAVVREYATNAFDAHVEAGVSLPIEVTLPSTLSPYLKIRDYGAGLDIEDIRTIYSRYGTSTKRETNDLVGTLGLGCKSALTYTNQFTLQGIKDGRCIQVAISREEDGTGSMKVVTEYETDEASGVEVTIPTKARNNFEEKATYLFQFWEEGTVLVNGETPKQLTGIEISESVHVVREEMLHRSVVVMGNVAYPMDPDPFGNFSVVAYVEMGAVQFTPSREALQMTPETQAVISEIRSLVETSKKGVVERLISEAKSKPEALEIALEGARLFGYRGDLTYQGEVIPFQIERKHAGQETPIIMVNRFKWRYGRSSEKANQIPISVAEETIFLTGHTNKTFSGYGRQKLEQWFESEVANLDGMNVQKFMLLNELPHADWIDPRRIYDYSVVAAQKIARKAREDGAPAGAYSAIVDGKRMDITADEIDSSRPIFWYESRNDGMMTIVRDAFPDAVIVELTSNRVAKFERLFPAAKRVSIAAREIAQKWADKLKPQEAIWLALSNADRNMYSVLDVERIDDPNLKTAVKLATKKVNTAKLTKQHRQYSGLFTIPETTWLDPMKTYPLLELVLDDYRYHYKQVEERTLVLEHLYTYVNSVYHAATTKETN